MTRPQPAADALVARLNAGGRAALAAPVTEYTPVPFTLPDLAAYHALAFTSAEGVRVFADNETGRGKPVFCVGDATAAAARAAGFEHIRSADGDAGDLLELLGGQKDIKRVLHVSGTETARELRAPLALRGITLDRVAVYGTRLLDRLPSDAENALRAGTVTAALLFSARAAGRLPELLPEGAREKIEALCISPRVALAAGAGWRAVRAAPRPDLESMLGLLRITSCA